MHVKLAGTIIQEQYWLNMSDKHLTINRFRDLWRKELVPAFKKDILAEIKIEIGKRVKATLEGLDLKIREMSKQIDQVENSQSFLDGKYDKLLEELQTAKK